MGKRVISEIFCVGAVWSWREERMRRKVLVVLWKMMQKSRRRKLRVAALIGEKTGWLIFPKVVVLLGPASPLLAFDNVPDWLSLIWRV
jgi:hypothetical protein